MGYFRLIRAHLRFLTFAFLLNFCSGVGQTFFLALFVPSLLIEFHLSNARFGTLFSAITLAGGLFLPFVGRLLDAMPLRRYALFSGVWVAGFCWLTAGAWNLPALLLGLWGLRLAGQGLLPHASATVVAHGFDRSRGRALSLSGLGYPLGEAFFPMLAVGLLAALGWRHTWTLMGLGMAVIYLPLAVWLVPARQATLDERSAGPWKRSWESRTSEAPPVYDTRFFVLLLSSLVPAFFLTPLFLYQSWLATAKGWTPEWMAGCFTAFAAARFASALTVGPLIDRFGAAKLYPYYLVPFALGMITLIVFRSPWAAVGYLAFTGMTVGMGGNLKTALWVELYGLRHLGSTRALASSSVIIATATGPLLWGNALDIGMSPDSLLAIILAAIAIATLIGALTLRRLPAAFPLRRAPQATAPTEPTPVAPVTPPKSQEYA